MLTSIISFTTLSLCLSYKSQEFSSFCNNFLYFYKENMFSYHPSFSTQHITQHIYTHMWPVTPSFAHNAQYDKLTIQLKYYSLSNSSVSHRIVYITKAFKVLPVCFHCLFAQYVSLSPFLFLFSSLVSLCVLGDVWLSRQQQGGVEPEKRRGDLLAATSQCWLAGGKHSEWVWKSERREKAWDGERKKDVIRGWKEWERVRKMDRSEREGWERKRRDGVGEET